MKLGSKLIRLGKGNKINEQVIDYITFTNNGYKARYFVKDIYGGSFEVDKKHYDEIKKYLGEDIERVQA